MALNRRTIILLVVAIAIWGVALFVLMRMNSPKPLQNVTSSPTSTSATPTTANNEMTQSGTDESHQNYKTADTPKIYNMSFSSVESIMPEATFTNFFKPYLLNLKVAFPSNIFKEASNLSNSSKQIDNQRNPLEQYGESDSTEVIPPGEMKYLGFVKIKDGKELIQKIYIDIAGTSKSFLDSELLEGRYKILQISQFFLIVLDTFDGKLKKIIYEN